VFIFHDESAPINEMIKKINELNVEATNTRAATEVKFAELNKKHSKPTTANPQGGIVEKEGPIHISNLMLIDPKGGKPTRVGRKAEKGGKLVRISKRTGEVIK
jgi:large subunit ribosomal protein L24